MDKDSSRVALVVTGTPDRWEDSAKLSALDSISKRLASAEPIIYVKYLVG